MKWSSTIWLGFGFALWGAALGCDEPEPKQKMPPAVSPPSTVSRPVPETDPRPWFEGDFRGVADLSAEPDALTRDRAERDRDEPPEVSAEGTKLSLHVSVSEAKLSGEGTLGPEKVTVSGRFDDAELRLLFVGPQTRGVWVGSASPEAMKFTGTVKASTTLATETGTTVQPYSGSLVLEKVR